MTGLPVAWQVETAKDSEIPMVPVLLDSVAERGFAASVAILDRGYETEALYTEIESRGMRPVIPLRQTPAVKAGKHNPPLCEHGTWAFAGVRRQARGLQVALPHRGVQARVRVAQGRPAAHADLARHRPVEGPVPPARRGRAGVRPVQARVGHAPAAGPPAARGPDRPRPARLRAPGHANPVGTPVPHPAEGGAFAMPGHRKAPPPGHLRGQAGALIRH